MSKFEIYQLGKLPPLTIVEADKGVLDHATQILTFKTGDDVIALFNWKNIAGFKEIENPVNSDLNIQ